MSESHDHEHAPEMPAPQMTPPPMGAPMEEDYRRALTRQARVIELLKDQVGSIVLANTEQAAHIEEMRGELGELRAALAEAAPPAVIE